VSRSTARSEDIMLMLFWLPMIILGGIWSIAMDAASGEAERGHSPARRDDEAEGWDVWPAQEVG
jgi:hypothetical protein